MRQPRPRPALAASLVLAAALLAPTARGQNVSVPGWTCTANADLCVEDALQSSATMADAIAGCTASEARVCTHADLLTACGIGGYNPFDGSATGWYGDIAVAGGAGTTTYGAWNRDHCTADNDGPAVAGTSSDEYRCCKGARLLQAVGGSAATIDCLDGWAGTATGDVCAQTGWSGPGSLYPDAVEDCWGHEARVCTHKDMVALAGVSGLDPFEGSAEGWLGDHSILASEGDWDDEFIAWGPARSTNYLGCFGDNTGGVRDLADGPHTVSGSDAETSAAECAGICSDYAYFGLQWQNEWWARKLPSHRLVLSAF